MKDRTITIFGGTGFLGRRIGRHLCAAGASVRIVSRHPQRARAQFGNADPELEAIAADVHREELVASAVADAYGVVNAVSFYVERGKETFPSVHVRAAARVANQACRRGVERLAHVSGIGADPTSGSPYICSRGEGEVAVRAAFPGATIIRPAVLFGPDEGFLTVLTQLLRRLPAYPMFGQGTTQLQPAYVDDVAEAVVRALQASTTHPITYELGGPSIYIYKELLQTIARRAEIRRVLVPVPFPIWAQQSLPLNTMRKSNGIPLFAAARARADGERCPGHRIPASPARQHCPSACDPLGFVPQADEAAFPPRTPSVNDWPLVFETPKCPRSM